MEKNKLFLGKSSFLLTIFLAIKLVINNSPYARQEMTSLWKKNKNLILH